MVLLPAPRVEILQRRVNRFTVAIERTGCLVEIRELHCSKPQQHCRSSHQPVRQLDIKRTVAKGDANTIPPPIAPTKTDRTESFLGDAFIVAIRLQSESSVVDRKAQ